MTFEKIHLAMLPPTLVSFFSVVYLNITTSETLFKVQSKINDPELKKLVRSKLNVNVTSNDPNFYGAHYYDEDHGTANIAVLAPNGDAVVATSTINLM